MDGGGGSGRVVEVLDSFVVSERSGAVFEGGGDGAAASARAALGYGRFSGPVELDMYVRFEVGSDVVARGGEDGAAIELTEQSLQCPTECTAGHGVQPVREFVDDQWSGGFVHEPGDHEAVALAVAQFCGFSAPGEGVGEADLGEVVGVGFGPIRPRFDDGRFVIEVSGERRPWRFPMLREVVEDR